MTTMKEYKKVTNDFYNLTWSLQKSMERYRGLMIVYCAVKEALHQCKVFSVKNNVKAYLNKTIAEIETSFDCIEKNIESKYETRVSADYKEFMKIVKERKKR